MKQQDTDASRETTSGGMMDNNQQTSDMLKMASLWMDTAKSFWMDLGREGASNTSASGDSGSSKSTSFFSNPSSASSDDKKYKTYRTWETSINNFTSLMQMMSTPENQEALAKGIGSLFEGAFQASGDSLENFAEFQKQVMQSFSKIGEHTKAYNFDELDHTVFESFRELYRSELQKYLFVPKVGLPRELHEQFSHFIDKTNIFYSHLMELLYLFSLPFENTNRIMQEKMKEMLNKGEFIDDPKLAYNEWVKVLEGNFMELLRSPDYLRVLNNTISALASYKTAKSEIINVFLKDQQIPTNKDMDAVYKDMYEMKKKIRELTREVSTLKEELKSKNTN